MAEGASMLNVFTIVERQGLDKPFWVKIGAAFPNRDGSVNVYLDALPANGRLHIRERNPDPEGESR